MIFPAHEATAQQGAQILPLPPSLAVPIIEFTLEPEEQKEAEPESEPVSAPELPIDPQTDPQTEITQSDLDQGPDDVTAAHQACLDGIDADVTAGREAATQWVHDGGGILAEHCLAIADGAAGFPRLAGIRIFNLAESQRSGDTITRARLYAQAAEFFLIGDETEQASNAVGAGFALVPEAAELYLLSAEINKRQERWQAAIDAVNGAEDAGFTNVDALVIRARGYKELNRIDDAANDLASALRIDPFHLDALVLRGELAQRGVHIKTQFRRTTPEPQSESEPRIKPEKDGN